MRTWPNLLATTAILLLRLPLSADERITKTGADPPATPATAELAPLARLVGGLWYTPGQFNDPTKGGIQVQWEWGLSQRFLRGNSYIIDDDGKRSHVYETIVYYHPGRKQVVFESHAAWGELYQGTIQCEGDTWKYEWTAYRGETVKQYRQTLHFPDNDTYEWKVWVQEGADWKLIKDGKLARQSPGT